MLCRACCWASLFRPHYAVAPGLSSSSLFLLPPPLTTSLIPTSCKKEPIGRFLNEGDFIALVPPPQSKRKALDDGTGAEDKSYAHCYLCDQKVKTSKGRIEGARERHLWCEICKGRLKKAGFSFAN